MRQMIGGQIEPGSSLVVGRCSLLRPASALLRLNTVGRSLRLRLLRAASSLLSRRSFDFSRFIAGVLFDRSFLLRATSALLRGGLGRLFILLDSSIHGLPRAASSLLRSGLDVLFSFVFVGSNSFPRTASALLRGSSIVCVGVGGLLAACLLRSRFLVVAVGLIFGRAAAFLASRLLGLRVVVVVSIFFGALFVISVDRSQRGSGDTYLFGLLRIALQKHSLSPLASIAVAFDVLKNESARARGAHQSTSEHTPFQSSSSTWPCSSARLTFSAASSGRVSKPSINSMSCSAFSHQLCNTSGVTQPLREG